MKYPSICRWGILGAATIARKNWKSIHRSGNGVVTAVASRDLSRAETFIRDCSMEVPPVTVDEHGDATLLRPAALSDYAELLQRDDVDAVYVALPTVVRKEWVLAAAAAGKHVLSEKPVAVHTDDAQEMIQACRQAGVGFMDGVMFDHGARLPALRKTLADSEGVGQLHRIQSHFSFHGGEDFDRTNIRAKAAFEPHGCLGDLGWYCIRFSLWAADRRLPVRVAGRSLWQLDGGQVPGEFQAELDFGDGLTAGFFCSFRGANQQTVTLTGERGYVTVDDFVLPFVGAESQWQQHNHDLRVDNCRWNFGRHTIGHAVWEHASGEPESQEVRMFRTFADRVVESSADTWEERWSDATELVLKTQQVLNGLRDSDARSGSWVTLAGSAI